MSKEMTFTGGGWRPAERFSPKSAARVIDAHLHIFPRLGSQGDSELLLRLWRHHLRDWLVYWRKDTGERVEGQLLDVDSNADDRLGDVPLRFTDFGQAEVVIEGVEYVLQLFPPSLVNMEAPPRRMLAEMDMVGVDMAVLQSDHLYGDLSEFYSRAMDDHPGRFIGLAQVWEPAADQVLQLERVRRAVSEHGCRGLYFSVEPFSVADVPATLDDPRFDALWRLIQELGIPIFWYLDDRADDRAGGFMSRIDELGQWMGRYPEIVSVITHGLVPAAIIHDTGFPEPLLALLRKPNVYAEVLFPAKWPDYPYVEGQGQMRFLRDEVGAGSLLWGSDSPFGMGFWCTYSQALDFIRRHCDFLSVEEKASILGENAARVFGLDNHPLGR